MSTSAPRLPRLVESEPCAPRLQARLVACARPLHEDGAVQVPVLPLDTRLLDALRQAQASSALIRGLEAAERALVDEARGMALADARSGARRGARVSRLLIVSQDGSRRFYRNVEALLKHHGERLLVVQVEADEAGLGRAVFGADAVARALLVTSKAGVARCLLALAPETADPDGPAVLTVSDPT